MNFPVTALDPSRAGKLSECSDLWSYPMLVAEFNCVAFFWKSGVLADTLSFPAPWANGVGSHFIREVMVNSMILSVIG